MDVEKSTNFIRKLQLESGETDHSSCLPPETSQPGNPKAKKAKARHPKILKKTFWKSFYAIQHPIDQLEFDESGCMKT